MQWLTMGTLMRLVVSSFFFISCARLSFVYARKQKVERWSSLMDKFQTERSKASSSSTQSESNNTERYHYYNGIDKVDRPPSMPLQFQVKLIVGVVYPATRYEKILCLYHYDYVNQRTREDLYKIKDNKHAQRYFTSIKKYDEEIKGALALIGNCWRCWQAGAGMVWQWQLAFGNSSSNSSSGSPAAATRIASGNWCWRQQQAAAAGV